MEFTDEIFRSLSRQMTRSTWSMCDVAKLQLLQKSDHSVPGYSVDTLNSWHFHSNQSLVLTGERFIFSLCQKAVESNYSQHSL